MKTRIVIGVLGVAILIISAGLLHKGVYGLTLFVLIPVLIGAVAPAWANSKTAWSAAGVGILANLVASLFLLALGAEGLICVVMAWPLVLPLGALGGALSYWAQHRALQTQAGAMLLILPIGSLGWDFNARPPVFEVRSSIEIDAPPEQVWKHVVTFSELEEPHEWFFQAGLAYPKRARIEGTGPGAIRYCEFSTGPFVEPIEVWDEPQLLRFRVTENPAPMHEWSPYAQVLPKHLHGYLVSKQGQFRLTPLSNNRTLLEGTTWYQHGLWPAHYWRWWSDAIIHRIHMRVLSHIRALSEG
ncbi:MAG TPA: SRPBCC family protein [Bryobacteraceae bacterium]|jgi:hypothetical protein|nr:SRPBCC family protein [Bryobacteraceae bacterium]